MKTVLAKEDTPKKSPQMIGEQKQQLVMKDHIAKVRPCHHYSSYSAGKPAPVPHIPNSMVDAMKQGSVIVSTHLAIHKENGGNCRKAPSQVKLLEKMGAMTIDGSLNLPSTMQVHSSQLYAKNVSTLIAHIKVHEFDTTILNYLNLPDWALSFIGFGQ